MERVAKIMRHPEIWRAGSLDLINYSCKTRITILSETSPTAVASRLSGPNPLRDRRFSSTDLVATQLWVGP